MMAQGAASVESLLEARCAQCHGVRRQKAGVPGFPVAEIFAGSRDDWVVIPGSPEKSSLLARMKLPAGHDDIMPPSGPPLTASEIEQIEIWIREGADPKAASRIPDGGMRASGNGNRGQAIRPRIWLREYMSLDLTKAQRSLATKTSKSASGSFQTFSEGSRDAAQISSGTGSQGGCQSGSRSPEAPSAVGGPEAQAATVRFGADLSVGGAVARSTIRTA